MTRPALHFTPREGWINDPLGLTYHGGTYHLFFQFVPGQTVWGPECRWGHAVSDDLLTWTERAIALEPGDGDGGCWSGAVVVDPDGRASIFYTSVQIDDLDIGRIRRAHPTDDTWDAWRKGPVAAEVPATQDATVFRDPYLFRDRDTWRMLVGSGRSDGTATALSYSSSDLATWGFDGEFASRSSTRQDPLWTGTVWECPQLLSFGDRHVMVFSVWEPWIPYYGAYAVGRLMDGTFLIQAWGRLTYGDAYYAGSAFTDAAGHPGMIHWLRGVGDVEDGWAGAHSLPHQMRLGDDDVLIAEPHPAIAYRRGRKTVIRAERDPIRADLAAQADVEWAVPPDEVGDLSVTSSDGTPVFCISKTAAQTYVSIGTQTWPMPYTGSLRMVFDGPIVELFSKAGIFAAPMEADAARTISVTAGTCLIYEL